MPQVVSAKNSVTSHLTANMKDETGAANGLCRTKLQIVSLDMILQQKNGEKRNKEREIDGEQGVVA
jgi:hypothetical protein